MSPLPRAVSEAFDAWGGGGGQQPINWSRRKWKKWAPERQLLDDLANPVGREDVARVFERVDDENSAVDAFVAAMVWGFGRVGYGPYRTRRILDLNRDAAARLLEIAQITFVRGGPAGFADMAANPLKHLGVAFGTKYLYFCAAARPDGPPAPVLDRIVRRWLATEMGVELDIWRWNTAHYEVYCNLLSEWSSQRGISVGEAEEAIFEHALRGPPKAERTGTVHLPIDTPLDSVGDLLDELDETVARLPNLGADDRATACEHLKGLRRTLNSPS